jgi:outer membrane protein OmpA-like peptidoglycan-associated protein/sporulation protein YlmC with PRC-barrel domain
MKQLNTLIMGLALGCFFVTTALAGTQARQETHKTSGAFRVNTLYGYEVLNPSNKVVGTIADFVVTPQGHIKYIFLSPTSWWGSQDRLYVIPWTSLTPQRDQEALILNFPQERLQQAPSFARNNGPSLANANWDTAYQQYYSQQMAQEQQSQQHMEQRAMQPTAARGQRQGAATPIDTDVLFNFGEARLTQEARDSLDNLVSQLKNTDFGTIHLTGHADRIGSDEANFTLARRRATRVAAYLAEQGIDPTTIRILSLGEEVPVTTGQETGRPAQERRVDIIVQQPRMASTAPRERAHTASQENNRQAASRSGSGASTGFSATVLDVDKENGTITVNTEDGGSIELQANDALLNQLTEGESVEVRLRKLNTKSQQSPSSQSKSMSEQQAR